MKKVLSLFLSFVMIASSVICVDLSAYASGETITNRVEWLTKLVQTFDMTVEEDNYPDNYFSDLTEDSEYYRDILVAAEFGLIDVEAGDPVYPDGIITREFAAQTLNFCLGYTLEDEENIEYTFADFEECEYAYDDQIAVNREWFALIDGNFCPEQEVTSTEITFMLEDANAALKEEEIDANYDNEYQFAQGTVEVANGTQVEIDENENVTIYDTSVKISAGDSFVVYVNEIPVIYEAKSVTADEEKIIIATQEIESEQVVENIDMQQEVDISADDFIPGDGYNVVEEPVSPLARLLPKSAVESKDEIKLEKTFYLSNGNSIKLLFKISNLKAEIKTSTKDEEALVALLYDLEVDVAGEFNLQDISKDYDDIENLGKVRIAGIGFVEFKPKLNFSGKVDYKQKYTGKIGFKVNGKEIRNISKLKKEYFTLKFEVSGELGIKVALGVDIFVVEGKVYGEIGAKISVYAETSETPDKVSTYCLTMNAYMYVNVGVELIVGFGPLKYDWKKEWQMFDDKNSPVRLYYHLENCKEVEKCTVGSKTKPKYTTPTTSKYGSVYTENLAENVVSSGDFVISPNPDGTAAITDYKGSAKNLSIPMYINGYKVTSIGDGAFRACNSLTSVTIPNSVTRIGNWAFWDCDSLTSVTIPNSVRSISNDAFENCDSLTSITVESNNTNYSSQDGVLFDKNKTTLIQYPIGNARTSYTIPNSVTSIDYWAFDYCDSLTSVTIPDSVTSICGGAFSNCDSLTSITIPDSVTSINWEAFAYCDSLTSVTIPNSVTSIGDGAFSYCYSLTSVTVDSNNTNYSSQDGVLFDKNKTTLIQYPIGNARTSYTIPNSVISISDYAFRDCDSLTSVTIGNSVTSIGYDAFRDCISLTSVTIGNSVTSIGDYAFLDCYSLTSVTIGNSVTSIGDAAFGNCDSLTDVYYSGTIDEWNLISIGSYNECLINATIHCSDGVIDNKHEHAWDNGVVTVNPTCTANGVKTFTCTACGDSYTEPIPATGHNYASYTVTPTCTAGGYTQHICTVCGITYNDSFLNSLGHNFGNNSPSCLVCVIGNPYYVAPTQPAPPTTQTPTAPAKEGTTKIAAVKKPKTESIKKLSKGKKSFKAYWKKLSGVTGYQIQYSTSKKFTKKTTKTVTVKGYKNTSKTIKKLKGGKKYYVRVRAYNKAKINGKTKTAYGSWSKIKSVTVKK